MEKTTLGLSENLEGLFCYILGWITGIIFLILEKNSKFVKFHALQSIFTFLPISIIGVIFMWIPIVGVVINWILSIISFILWILLMYKAYQGEKYKLPIVGDFAEKEIK